MKTIRTILLLISLSLYAFQTWAVPAYPYPVKITQPDGSTLNLLLKGDEHHHYATTEDGIAVIRNSKGVYNYARIDAQGKLTDLKMQANNAALRGATERNFIASIQSESGAGTPSKVTQSKLRSRNAMLAGKPQRFPLTGTPRSLVILVNFSDNNFKVTAPNTAFTNMLNQPGYSANDATGSAKDYFKDNSMGSFNPQFDVVGPFTLPNNIKYYGENDADDYDKRPAQMIVDACTQAKNNGVDFSVYDTDNDGYVDNVFVYYAGYNEAEWGDENTIWPHRWAVQPGDNYTGTTASITFNGKKIFDYACTSELSGSSGSNMAGIGTFTHEFGHVLGLPDFYATDGAEHHTLNEWSIMDYGPYLNNGKTPPSYNAYERFMLGYITPTVLNSFGAKTLKPLNTDNEAYIVTQSGTHNLSGANPNPKEFFMLENRQNTGWDTFLPGKGMLVYRINYDATKWENNEPNNNPNAMGVDLMEADGIANETTFDGDPFPGTANVSSFSLSSRTGTNFFKRIASIAEAGNNITFNFEKEVVITANPKTLSFAAIVGGTPSTKQTVISSTNVSAPISYSITGANASQFSADGNGTLPASGGTINLSFSPTSEGDKLATLTIIHGTVSENVQLNGTASLPPLEAPIVTTDPSSLTTTGNGFIATWGAVNEADGYELHVYTKTAGNGIQTVLSEDFGKITKGAANANVNSTDIASNMNSYTQTSGWTGSKIYEAGGAVKLGSASALGSLSTPILNLAADNGSFTLSFDAMAWSNDSETMKIFLNNTLAHTVTTLNNSSYTFAPFQLQLTGGTAVSTLRFEGKTASKSRFFLDNIVISQGSPAVLNQINNSPFSVAETKKVITGLSQSENYFYTVATVKGARKSLPSVEVGPISLTTTSAHYNNEPLLNCRVTNGMIHFNALNAGEMVECFNAQGQSIYRGISHVGENNIDLRAKGLVIIKVGARSEKLYL